MPTDTDDVGDEQRRTPRRDDGGEDVDSDTDTDCVVARDRDTTQVASQPRRVLAGAIGVEDGQCAAYYAGIGHRCTNDAEYHAWMEFEGEWQVVEMCADHVRPGELPGDADSETDDADRSPQSDQDGTHDLTEYTR